MSLSELARAMRRAPVATERILWAILRDRRLEGMKFRRQVPLGGYIADFVCFRHRLIIEADGPFHDPVSDARRDSWLRSQGFRVLRFPNATVEGRPRAVVAAVLATALHAPLPTAVDPSSGPSGHLLPQGEKGL